VGGPSNGPSYERGCGIAFDVIDYNGNSSTALYLEEYGQARFMGDVIFGDNPTAGELRINNNIIKSNYDFPAIEFDGSTRTSLHNHEIDIEQNHVTIGQGTSWNSNNTKLSIYGNMNIHASNSGNTSAYIHFNSNVQEWIASSQYGGMNFYNLDGKFGFRSNGAITRMNFLQPLPTSDGGLNTGDLYTQTATQLGGSGTDKVICIK
jgi:hypothetical protein